MDAETGRVDYRKFYEWVGLSGPMPDDHALAMHLENELGNREEVDAVESAVLVEAANALRDRAALREALGKASGYLMNAKIDLETGAPKRTAINTIEGALKMVREALGQGTLK